MTNSSLIQALIHIPHIISNRGDVSVCDLLSRAGYFDYHGQISVADVLEALASDPVCIDEWLDYSKNKRCDSGWYINRLQDGHYVVGYYPSGEKATLTCKDLPNACAEFIVREIENIRACFQNS